MPTYRSFLHRLRFALGDSLLIGGLIVWLGVIAVGWFSLEQATPRADNPPHTLPSLGDRPASATGTSRPRGASETPAPQPIAAGKSSRQTRALPDPPKQGSPTPSQKTAATHPDRTPSTALAQNTAQPTTQKTAPESAAQQSVAQPSPTNASAHVARAQFTSGVENHEPIDRLTQVFHSHGQAIQHLYYFTELTGLGGQTVTYHWRHAGREIAQVSFTIGGDRWRVYSSKRLTSAMTGRWTVVVTDEAGQTLSTASIVYKMP